MLNASALVIGIDKYDLAEIPVLSGCVVDAFKATEWLLELGVAADRIFLHVAAAGGIPADDPAISAVTSRAADLDSITASMNELSKGQGEKLFVFMSGHGLHVRSDGPIFLTKDYGVVTNKKNLRIKEYIRYFQSWPYRDQFVFYDACQNPTATIGQVSPVQAQGPDLQTSSYDPLPSVALTVCYSASAGQAAWAGNGHGILIDHVLRGLDPAELRALRPADQRQDAVLYDWTTGERLLDMKLLFDELIRQDVQNEAAAAGHYQNPYCERHGRAVREEKSAILRLDPEIATAVRVSITPPEALVVVKQIRLVVPTPSRTLYLPKTYPISNPFPCMAPTGALLEASCLAKDGSGWIPANSPRHHSLDGNPVDVELELRPSPPAPGPPSLDPFNQFNIRIVPPGGGPPVGHLWKPEDYPAIAENNKLNQLRLPKGLVFERNEIGPDISFDPSVAGASEAAGSLAASWLAGIRKHVSDEGLEVLLSRPGENPAELRPNLRIVLPSGGVQRLAGYLKDAPLLSLTPVGETQTAVRLSIADAERHPNERVEPGPYRVRIDLPWGRWTSTVFANYDAPAAEVRLPEKVGLEPLRNQYEFGSESDRAQIFSIPVRANDGSVDLLRDDQSTLGAMVSAEVSLLAVPAIDGVRVEPLSRTELPEWDMIFTAGRIDDFEEKRVTALVTASPSFGLTESEHSLLLLALGYASQARSNWRALRRVLRALTRKFRASIDARLLTNALESAQEGRRKLSAASLETLFAQPSLPLLRWGAGLADELSAAFGIQAPVWSRRLNPASSLAVVTASGAEEMIEEYAFPLLKGKMRPVKLTPTSAKLPAGVRGFSTPDTLSILPGTQPPEFGLRYISVPGFDLYGRDIRLQSSEPAVGGLLGPFIPHTVSAITASPDVGLDIPAAETLGDRFNELGAQIVKATAASEAGDGSATTTVVLAQAIAQGAAAALVSGANGADLKKGIDVAVAAVVKYLEGRAKPVTSSSQIAQIAITAAVGDSEIGGIIARAVEKGGPEGLIAAYGKSSPGSELKTVKGTRFDRGYLSPYFVTDSGRMTAVLNNALILTYDGKISGIAPILPFLETAIKSGRPLLIIAHDVEGEALATLVTHKLRGGLNVAAVRAPEFGDRRKAMLEDIAIMTGAQVISATTPPDASAVLGTASTVVVAKESCTIIDGKGEKSAIERRIAEIEAEIASTASGYDTEKLQERLAKLADGLTVLAVGGDSESDAGRRIELAHRTLNSVRMAIKGGFVPGGGVALLKARRTLQQMNEKNPGVRLGIEIVAKALEVPLRQIADNSGTAGAEVVGKVEANPLDTFGYDARQSKYTDMVSAGILDAALVVSIALRNAASLSVEILIDDRSVMTTVPTKPKTGETDGGASGMEA